MKTSLLFISLCAILAFNFQGCGGKEYFSQDSDQLKKNCVEGKVLGIWLDPDKSNKLDDKNYLGNIIVYSGNETAKANYDYYSASAHPISGPSPEGYALNVFLYEGSDGLSLNFFANKDAEGSPDNKMDIIINTSGNGAADNVILSDDKAELQEITNNNNKKKYEGDFRYWHNTDGGVIGPFIGDEYKIAFEIDSVGDVNSAQFYSADGSSFSLPDNKGNVSSFIISYEGQQSCN